MKKISVPVYLADGTRKMGGSPYVPWPFGTWKEVPIDIVLKKIIEGLDIRYVEDNNSGLRIGKKQK